MHNENEDFYAVIEEGRRRSTTYKLTGDRIAATTSEDPSFHGESGPGAAPQLCAAKRTTSRAWASRTTVSPAARARKKRRDERGESRPRNERKTSVPHPDCAAVPVLAPLPGSRIGAAWHDAARDVLVRTSAGCARTQTCAWWLKKFQPHSTCARSTRTRRRRSSSGGRSALDPPLEGGRRCARGRITRNHRRDRERFRRHLLRPGEGEARRRRREGWRRDARARRGEEAEAAKKEKKPRG